MKFFEAFKALGYGLDNHLNEWSAEADHGVCMKIWKEEMEIVNGFPIYDLDLPGRSSDLNDWTNKSGQTKRTRHLCRAIDEFNGDIDVVLLAGPPGGPYKDADPWFKQERGMGWHIVRLDRTTGGFRAENNQNKSY